MEDALVLSGRLDDLAVTSRLQDLALFTVDGRAERIEKVAKVLSFLPRAVYLLGAGPYSQRVVSLMCDEAIIGRMSTPLEEILDRPVDIFVNDGVGLLPREVSRVHCAIYRREGPARQDYWIIDKGSRCGTYLNGELIHKPASDHEEDVVRASRTLTSGDVISLGASQINSFIFADLRG